MKLLIVTQKVNRHDPILGFFHSWIKEFARYFEVVTVICLEKGEYDLPDNVRILSLGKEERQSRLQYIIHFYWYIIHERKNYDIVFVHMNQIYVVLGGLLWKAWGKKIAFWYTHRALSLNLRIATFLSHHIFTVAKESFRIKTKKLNVIGHGIATENFKRATSVPRKRLSLISVGRITRIKNLDTFIQAVAILKQKGVDVIAEIVGPQVTPDDTIYFNELKSLVEKHQVQDQVIFKDAVSNEKLKEYYWRNDMNINLTPTGGVDKVIIEGIAAGTLPLASNKAFESVFGPYSSRLIFKLRDPADLADKIIALQQSKDIPAVLQNLQKKIEVDFGLKNFIVRMMNIIAPNLLP